MSEKKATYDRIDDRTSQHVYEVLETLKEHNGPVFDYYTTIDRDPNIALNEIFRTSFKLSAGSPILQTLLQLRASQLLKTQFEDETEYNGFLAGATFNSDSFVIPKRHVALRPHRVEGRTKALWDFFISVCRDEDELQSLLPKDTIGDRELRIIRVFGASQLLPVNITYFMTQRELIYMREGRPNRPDEKSRHRSLIRDCGLEGKPTGCLEMDVLMQEVASLVEALILTDTEHLPDLYVFKNTKRDLHEIAERWETINLERTFLQRN